MTADEWKRIDKYISEGPAHVYLDTTGEGTCVIIGGFGVLHPKAYLDIMEDTSPIGTIDILKRTK